MGRQILIIAVALLLGVGVVIPIISCSQFSPPSTPITKPQTTEPAPATTLLPTQESITRDVKLADPIDDLFNKEGGKVQGELYLDIVDTEISLVQNDYVFKINLRGPLPSFIDAPAFIEWDIMVDSDRNLATGWNDPVVFGNIGADYRIFLGLKLDKYTAFVHDTKSNTYKSIEYKVDTSSVELRCPKSSFPVDNFNYTVVARKYAKEGNAGSLVSADKAPNQGHCTFPTVPSNSETSPAIENKPITLRIICDDKLIDSQMKPGFGFSCLVTLPEANILFDTGSKAEILLNNMEQLQVNPEQINAVVLSHEHPDHVGGLVGFLKKKSSLPVYIPKSFSDDIKSSIRTAGAKVVEIFQPEEIFSGVFTTGELGNNIKEQSLILKSSEGLILITGCSHPGILNIIRIVKSQFPNDKLYLVIGGFHLQEETAEQLKLIINSFQDLGVINVAPCHCSGSEARELFRQTFGNGYIDVGEGTVLNLPTSKP